MVLRVPIGERCTTHVEYFSLIDAEKEDNLARHFLSAGAAFHPTPNLEIGVRGGISLNDDAARYFINIGGGIRF